MFGGNRWASLRHTFSFKSEFLILPSQIFSAWVLQELCCSVAVASRAVGSQRGTLPAINQQKAKEILLERLRIAKENHTIGISTATCAQSIELCCAHSVFCLDYYLVVRRPLSLLLFSLLLGAFSLSFHTWKCRFSCDRCEISFLIGLRRHNSRREKLR